MKKTEKHALAVRIALLVMLDILFMQVASFASLWIRHEFDFQAVEETFIHTVWRYMPLNILVTLAVFSMFHLYTSLWKYASITELSCIVAAVAISSLLHVLGMAVMGLKMFKSYLLLYFLLFLFMVVGLRFSYRFFRFVRNKCNRGMAEKRENVMIIGAGDAGAAIIKENRLSKAATRKVCCLIDKDPKKWGRYILGCPVVGGADKIMESVEKYKIQKIVIAIPSATSQQIKELVEICKETKCELKILPGIYQLIDGEVSISQLREVEIEDLLGREPVKVDLEEILGYIQGKTVLVTGGGGSIGSEICRQLAGHGVGKLIIFDVYENNAYAIQQELKRKYPNLDLEVLIGSVRNTSRMNDVFATYHPEIVFHAAAHKHVPLMEDSPNEAIKNNVIGTYKTAKMASDYGVKKFILISTDKAVNPTNIMGASKRLCEMVIQTIGKKSQTEFAAVRFGNVLGSNGSVIPLFKEQIKNGGPVTVTHKDIIRYFMTIPEAVSLVLQAGAYAKNGEIFVLNMGEPVKIVDLARNLIKLSGYEPDVDIKIEFTGLRPGEKLYEELLMDEEGMWNFSSVAEHGYPSLVWIAGEEPLPPLPEGSAVTEHPLRTEHPSAEYIQIRTPEDLMKISENPGGKYILMNNISMEQVRLPENQTSYIMKAFSGELDGNNQVIHGLRASLFDLIRGRSVNAKATVKNLRIQNVFVTAGEKTEWGYTRKAEANGLARSVEYGHLETIYMNHVKLNGGTNTASLSGLVYESYVGKIWLEGIDINREIAPADLSNFNLVGGAIGQLSGYRSKFEDSYVQGEIVMDNNQQGGAVGEIKAALIRNVISNMEARSNQPATWRDKSGFLGSIDTFGTNGKNWWVDRCIAIGNAGANYKFLGKYQIETIEATNLTKCYELSSATGTSNVSEATIAKGTLLAAEEQQKYDVSFYRDVLTFNGNEGGADPDAWDFGSVSTKGYPTLKWLLTYDNLPITIEEPEHLEPSENQAEAQPGEEHTLELPEVVLPEEQPVLPEEEALQEELFGEEEILPE